MPIHSQHQSKSNEWYTPPHIISKVYDVLGHIDLDPCSWWLPNHHIIKANNYYTKHDNALLYPWHGKVYMNPPYGKIKNKSQAGIFVYYAISQFAIGNITEMIILVNSNTSTSYNQKLFNYSNCFLSSRIKFLNHEMIEQKQPTRDNLITYLGHNVARFEEVFSPLGKVWL